MQKKVAILSLDNQDLHYDSRVLRQVRSLSSRYRVSVISYGDAQRQIEAPYEQLHIVGSLNRQKWLRRMSTALFLPLGKFLPRLAYETWYWLRPGHRQALKLLKKIKPDFIHANDWWSLPAAVKGARASHTRIILDLHEYALDELSDNPWWRLFYQPLVAYFFKHYLRAADAYITVNDRIAGRYKDELGIEAKVVRNVPEGVDGIGFTPLRDGKIRLVHHGVAMRVRSLDLLVDVVRLLDERFTLTFMLVGGESYIRQLHRYAEATAPGRVLFIPPVRPKQVVSKLAEYDMGLLIYPSQSFEFLASLPNKFFEFMMAGLAVCVGPSPEMVKFLEQYPFGVVAPSFSAQDVAKTLNALDGNAINVFKRQAIAARKQVNAVIEMEKLLQVYADLEAKSASQ